MNGCIIDFKELLIANSPTEHCIRKLLTIFMMSS